MLLDYYAETHALSFKPSKFDYYFSEANISGSSYLLVKPATFVNNSGIAAKQVIDYSNADIKDFLVVYDDFNLQLSELRIRLAGGDGGHNGLNSVIYHLGTDQFPRLRIGIGNEFKTGEMADYVLTDFKEDEKKILVETFKTGSFLLEEFISGGINKMLDANSRLSKVKEKKDPED